MKKILKKLNKVFEKEGSGLYAIKLQNQTKKPKPKNKPNKGDSKK